MKRPMVWMLMGIISLFFIYRAVYSEKDDARYYIFQDMWEDETEAQVCGTVEHVVLRRKEGEVTGVSLYLEKVRLTLTQHRERYFTLQRLLVYLPEDLGLQPGYCLQINGTLQEISVATTPGQFDARAYYKEKEIYYQMQGKQWQINRKKARYWQSGLYHIRDAMASVYQRALPAREAGIVTAMLLGDKSLLDMDIKTLYQESGIGHILAISGVKTLKLDIPLVPETRINWAFVPLHIAIIYILKLCLDEEIIPRCRFPCSRGYLIKCINWQKKQSFSVRLILWQKSKNWQKEKMNMAYKKYREMKVYEASGYQYKRTPSIVLKGKWLSDLGFDIGEQIEVKCEDGRLVITKANEIWVTE